MGTNVTTDSVLTDANVRGHGFGGSLCPEVLCRTKDQRTGRSVKHCGVPKKCKDGVLNNGLGPVDQIEDLADVSFFGAGVHTNHALAAMATIAAQVQSGVVRFHTADYQENRTVSLLMEEKIGFSAEEALAVRKVHDLAVAKTGGTHVSVAAAKKAASDFVAGLTTEAYDRLYTPIKLGGGNEAKALIDHEDTMLVAAMLEVQELHGGSVTLVTGDRGFLIAGRILAEMFDNFYIVDPQTYVNAGRLAKVKNDYDGLRAAYTARDEVLVAV